MGCYEDKGPRLLSKTLLPKRRSVKSCLDAALAKGYRYAGLEYGGECYASNVKPAQSKQIGYDSCDMVCQDDHEAICGGPSVRVSLFLPDSLLNAYSFFRSRLLRCTVSLQQFRLIASETRLNTLSLSVSLSRLAAY